MKQLILTLLFITLTSLLFSQIEWIKEFPTGNGNGRGKFILENSAGEYLMIVNARDVNSNNFSYIQIADADGADLGQQLFPNITIVHGAVMAPTNDDIIIMGTTDQDLVLAKFDNSLNPIWETVLSFQTGWSPVGNQLTQAANGDLIVVGRKNNLMNPFDPPDWFAQRLTSDGTEIWAHSGTLNDGPASAAFEFASCSADFNNGNTLISGAYQFGGDGSFLRMLNEDGETVWTTYFDLSGTYQVPNKIFTSDLGIHVASFADNGMQKLSPNFSLFDTAGLHMFSKFYNEGTNGELNTSMVKTQLGNFYLSYCINDSLLGSDQIKGYLIKVDPQGEELCSMEFQMENFAQSRPYDILLTPENGIIAFGYRENTSQEGTQPFAIKTEDLCVLQSTIKLEKQIPIEMNVFPNPSSTGILYLDLNSQIKTEIEYSIFNVLGKEMGITYKMYIPIGQSQQTIDVSHLSKGSYFLKINNSEFQKTLPFKIF